MTQQLSTLYPEKDVKGKAFLVKAIGRALTAVKNRTLILDTLALIFNATQHSGIPYRNTIWHTVCLSQHAKMDLNTKWLPMQKTIKTSK